MVKKTISIVSVFLLISNIAICQNLDSCFLVASYRYIFTKDVSTPALKSEDFMLLYIGRKVSSFFSYNTYKVDSGLAADRAKGLSGIYILANRAKYGKLGQSYAIFQNYPVGKITVTEKIVATHYMYQEQPQIHWQIGNQTKTILNFKVHDAVCIFGGRKYTAWFSPDIPVSKGPWKLGGLPGLILEAEDSDSLFRFLCTGIQREQHYKISIPKDQYITLQKSEFQKLEAKFKTDPVSFINNSGGMRITPDAGNSQMLRPRHFNPIER